MTPRVTPGVAAIHVPAMESRGRLNMGGSNPKQRGNKNNNNYDGIGGSGQGSNVSAKRGSRTSRSWRVFREAVASPGHALKRRSLSRSRISHIKSNTAQAAVTAMSPAIGVGGVVGRRHRSTNPAGTGALGTGAEGIATIGTVTIVAAGTATIGTAAKGIATRAADSADDNI